MFLSYDIVMYHGKWHYIILYATMILCSIEIYIFIYHTACLFDIILHSIVLSNIILYRVSLTNYIVVY